jgi:hypothetical protein
MVYRDAWGEASCLACGWYANPVDPDVHLDDEHRNRGARPGGVREFDGAYQEVRTRVREEPGVPRRKAAPAE